MFDLGLKEDVRHSGEYSLLVKCLLQSTLDYLVAKVLLGSDEEIVRERRCMVINKGKWHPEGKIKRTLAQERIIKHGAEALEYILLPTNCKESVCHPFSFQNICTTIGIDPTRLRRRLLSFTPDQIREMLVSEGYEGFEWRP